MIRILGAVVLAVGTASTACAEWMDAQLDPPIDDAPAVVLHGAGMGLREGRAIIVEVESRDFIPFVSFLPFAPSQPETGGFSTRTVYDQVDGATVARDCLFRRPDGLGDFDAPVEVSVTAVTYEESGLSFPLTGAYRIRFIEVGGTATTWRSMSPPRASPASIGRPRGRGISRGFARVSAILAPPADRTTRA